jgi:HPt (histidine-containing phosphotransfer) domain-containing protein
MHSIATGRIRVQLPKEMADLVPGYMDRRRKDASAILAALGDRRFDVVRVTGHRMKGTGAAYGLGFVTQAGAQMEKAADEGDQEAVRTCVLDLVDFLARVDIVVESESAA